MGGKRHRDSNTTIHNYTKYIFMANTVLNNWQGSMTKIWLEFAMTSDEHINMLLGLTFFFISICKNEPNKVIQQYKPFFFFYSFVKKIPLK